VAYQVGRTKAEGGESIFFAYRRVADIPPDWEVERLVDPFPKPINRVGTTQARGKFRLPIRPAGELGEA
jgi:hypothetical protein